MSVPKGKLISVGGSEDKGLGIDPKLIQKEQQVFFEFGILKRILLEMK